MKLCGVDKLMTDPEGFDLIRFLPDPDIERLNMPLGVKGGNDRYDRYRFVIKGIIGILDHAVDTPPS